MTPTPAARRFLDNLTELYELREGSGTLETPAGPLPVAARIEVAGEGRRLLELSPESSLEDYCVRLAWLDREELAPDYLVFLTPKGRLAETSLRALAAPGPRRRFHLSLLLAEREGRLESLQEIDQVLSEALGQPLRATPDGLYTLDDAMSILARPLPDLPTLPAAARALGLFLGACGRTVLDRPFQLSGGRSPVFDFATAQGALRLEAGPAAWEALLSPARTSVLSDALRALGAMGRDPGEFPPQQSARWVRWVPRERDEASPVALKAAELGRERRQQSVDEGRMPDEPELLRVSACPGCGKLHTDFRTLEDFQPRHLAEPLVRLREAVERDRPGTACTCGAFLNFRNLQYLAYCQYFAWPGVDLHLELIRRKDGRLVESWGRIEAGGTFETLPGEPGPEAMERELGRRYSLAAHWAPLMEAAEASAEPRAERCGGLAWLLVLPPGRLEPTAQAVDRLLAQCPWETSAVLHLSDGPRLRPPPDGPTYHDWAPRFASRLEDGTYGTAALVNWPAFVDEVVAALRRDGLEPRFDPDRPGNLRLAELQAWGTLDLRRELAGGIHTGRYPEEVAARAAAQARASLREVNRVLQEIRRLAPPGSKVEVDSARHVLQVAPPAAEPVEIEVDGLVSRWARDGVALERQIRYLLAARADSLEQCRCGEPSHLAVRLRPPEWLAGLPEGRGQRLLRAPGEGTPRLYVRECPHHADFLETADLARMKLEASALETLLRRDLDRTGARVGVLKGPEDVPFLAAFLGHEAASLASHPSLVSGACDAAGLSPPEKVDVLAPDLNVLLVASPEAPREAVEALATEALAQAEVNPGHGGPLDHRATLVLGAARGRILVERR